MYAMRVWFGTVAAALLALSLATSSCGEGGDPGYRPPDEEAPPESPADSSDGGAPADPGSVGSDPVPDRSGGVDAGSGSPDAGSGTPDAGSGTPDAGSGTPDAGSGTPDAGSGTPDAGSGTPDAGSGSPDAGSGTPDAGSGSPDAGSGTPDAGSGTPDAGSGTPDAGSGTPDAGSGTPDAGGGGGGGGGGPLPDLRVSTQRLQDTAYLTWEYFNENSCAWVEHCLNGTGWRLLLRFATEIQNVGTADLVLGEPAGNNDFEWAGCHGHYHLKSSTDQELYDSDGNLVAVGLKQGFCWTDNVEVPNFPSQPRKYAFHGEDSCNVLQGLTVGWADVYAETLDCQWIDVTGIGRGNYLLRVYANPKGLIEELDYSNNIAEVELYLDPPPQP